MLTQNVPFSGFLSHHLLSSSYKVFSLDKIEIPPVIQATIERAVAGAQPSRSQTPMKEGPQIWSSSGTLFPRWILESVCVTIEDSSFPIFSGQDRREESESCVGQCLILVFYKWSLF